MFRRFFVVLSFILAIGLVACGGDEPATSGQPDEAGGSAAEPATATAEPATATAEPTPTPEPQPTPTLAPTPTEVAEVSPSEGDSGSGEAGAVAAGSGWGASGDGAQSACDHPYLPMRSGAMWNYETSEGPIIWEVVDVQGGLDEATAVLSVTVGDVSLEYQWQCSAGQGLSSFDFANLTSAPVGLDMTIEQVSVDGQFLLPPEEMVVGASWTAELLGTVSFSQEIEGTSIEATGDMKTVQEHTIQSADPVEFEGQSVPGLQIEQANTITLMLSLMGTAVEQTISVDNNYELGYGIGIVDQSSVTDFGTETMNLVSYTIP
ncbi:MAG: hypothetical protein PVJ75_11190 [Chloroflexota bacterium]|jgi:hypothetical protein